MTDIFGELYSDEQRQLPALVIGTAGQDVIAHLDDELHSAESNPARVRSSFGGVARNVAENLALLGQPVRLITAVGNDPIGNDILRITEAAGVDISATLRTSALPTGFYMGLLNTKGQLETAVDDMRIITQLTPEYLRQHEHLFKSSSLVFVDTNLPQNTLSTIFTLAKRSKIPVCADPTSRKLAARLSKHLSKIFLIAPNSVEAGILSGQPFSASDRRAALETARYFVRQGVKIALITLAEFGVVYATSETSGHIPALRTRISDPTGAGDALTAAVIFSVLNEIELDDSIRLGVAAASLTLRYQGTVYSNLSIEKLYDQLSS